MRLSGCIGFSGTHLLLLALLGGPLAVVGQPLSPRDEVPLADPGRNPLADPEVGLPFYFEHFDRQDYRQHHQNWAVAQDARGLIYAANYGGVLEYDGATWRLIPTQTNTIVRSLAVDEQGVIHLGVQGDFGYLEPDSSGTLQYVSLISRVAPIHRDIRDVWGTHVTSEGVYYQTTDRLFRWNGKTMRVWKSDRGLHTSFVVRDQFYVREKDTGLLHVVGEALELASGGARFAQVRIYAMMPYADNHVMIATREEGLFLYDGVTVSAFPTEIDGLLSEYRLYHGAALPGGLFALAMLDGGGVAIIDEQGRLVQHLHEGTGLPDGWVNHVYVDAQDGLWMAFNNKGLGRVDLASPLSLYDQDLGLEGHINSIQRHAGRLHVATTTGVYRLEEKTADGHETHAAFVQVLRGTSRALLSTDSVLFAATDGGLFALRGDNVRLLTDRTDRIFALRESNRDNTLFVGKKEGLVLLMHTSQGWTEQPVEPVDEAVRSMAEDADGALWISTADRQVLRLRSEGPASPWSIDHFSRPDGLPSSGIRALYAIDGEVIFSSVEGIFRFGTQHNEAGATRRFYRDPALFASAEASTDSLLAFFVDKVLSFWMVYPDRIEIARLRPDSSYVYEVPAVLRLPMSNTVHIYVEDDGIAWVGNGEQLIRYDSRIRKHYDAEYPVLVRRVVSAQTGQLLTGGAPQDAEALLTVKHVNNDLRFEVGLPSFNNVARNEYQYYLEGADEGWSAWTTRSSKRYDDLSGAYILRVRARNAQGFVSKEARFRLRVLPPWYRTWWAYSLYAALLVAASALYWRYHTVVQENKRAQEQARELARERHINERLQQANKRLQQANESLTQANQLKDEFLANTSHELRTPLTAILGFTSVLREELPHRFVEFLDPIESNGERLLRTVNSLLDLAKLRAGMMELRREDINVGAQAAEVIRLLAPLARQKDLLLEMVGPPQPLYVHLDQRYLERILYNLIGNAIKFTEQGTVSVEVEEREGRVQIRVRDTGIGIEEGFLPHLFDEFKQESTGLARLHEGSGLGLAITARLVDLMDGTIEVHSEKGKGSVFTVSFAAHTPPAQPPPAASRTAMAR